MSVADFHRWSVEPVVTSENVAAATVLRVVSDEYRRVKAQRDELFRIVNATPSHHPYEDILLIAEVRREIEAGTASTNTQGATCETPT